MRSRLPSTGSRHCAPHLPPTPVADGSASHEALAAGSPCYSELPLPDGSVEVLVDGLHGWIESTQLLLDGSSVTTYDGLPLIERCDKDQEEGWRIEAAEYCALDLKAEFGAVLAAIRAEWRDLRAKHVAQLIADELLHDACIYLCSRGQSEWVRAHCGEAAVQCPEDAGPP